jgi:dephospho-CoA kinase
MLKIGLTGGIGSGKSTVAKYFAELGITVIDADQIAHELCASNTSCTKKIIEHFGNKILNKDGTLNRSYLRKLIFQDAREKKWLEQLLHPLVYQEMQRQIQKATSPYCILVIPLLFETKAEDFVDRILVVDSLEQLQIKRIQKRDKISEAEIKKICASQIPRDEHLSRADDIIHNDKSLADLQKQVKKLHQEYLAFKSDNTYSIS